MKEINATYTKKQDLLRQQEQILNTKCIKVREITAKRDWALSEGIWPIPAFFTLSIILADLHSDKTVLLFPLWSVLRIWGENNGN